MAGVASRAMLRGSRLLDYDDLHLAEAAGYDDPHIVFVAADEQINSGIADRQVGDLDLIQKRRQAGIIKPDSRLRCAGYG